jgi:tetratricopeptide (TPR) repeat protein
MHVPANALLFAIIFGCLAQPRPLAAKVQGWAVGAWLPRLGLPALGCAILWVAWVRLPGEYWGEEARKALRDGLLPQSLALVEKSLRFGHENPEVYFYRGEAYRAMGRAQTIRVLRRAPFAEAVKAFDAALAIFPQDENAWIRRAQALDGLQRFEDAETAYLTAIALDPNLGALYAYYAAHLRRLGRNEEAQEQLGIAQHLNVQSFERILVDPLDVHRLRLPEAGE